MTMLQKTNPDVSGTVSAAHRRSFWVILGLYCLLALIYVYATPLFEAPDESYHYAFVQRMANGGALPVQERGKIGDWHQEGSQPPLYYLVGGTLLAPFDRRGLAQLNTVNPHAVIGNPGVVGNKNHYLHTSPYPPPLGTLEISGAALRVYLARLLSASLGLVTVAAVYGCTRELLPLRPNAALLAAALTAFNPQFIFISASVNNDTMVTALNSVALWQIMALVRAERFDLRRSIFLAVVVALATLSKLSGLVMVPVAALAGLWVAYRSRDLRGLFVLGGLMLTVWLALAGWWYARNLTLYNELLGSARMLDVFGRRPAPPLPDLLVELSSLFQSYWGVFGWFSILTAQPYYWFTTGLTLAGFSGLLLYFWRIRAERVLGMRYFFLSLAWVLGFISLLMWTLQTTGTQGRLLFPYITAASPLLAIGLLEWGGRLRELVGLRVGGLRGGMMYHAPTNATLWRNPTAYLGLFIPAALVLWALLIPFLTLIPVYLPPAPMTAPPEGIVTAAEGGDVGVFLAEDGTPAVALAGYQTDVSQRYAPGDTVPITLYWRPLLNLEGDYSLYIHLTRATDGAIIGQVDTFPGWGSWRTSMWVPAALDASGYLIPDAYTVRLNPDADGVSALDARVGWWHPVSDTRLASTNPGNIDPYALVLRVGGFVGRETLPDTETFKSPAVEIRFGGRFALVGYRLDDDGMLMLMWETLATPQADYTVVALLTDGTIDEAAEFRVIAQADAPPDLPTRYRRTGERFLTVHRWQYAEDGNNQAKTLPIYVGWYDTSDPAYPRLETDSPHNLAYVSDMPFEP